MKILGVSRDKTEADLIALGAEKTFDGEIRALYYDFPDKSLGARRDVLRLRREGPSSVLTFKRHVSAEDAKVMEERETRVSDFETARWIIESIGLSVWLEMRKHRTTYSLEGVHFEFDKYSGPHAFIPEFLEIEAGDTNTVYRYAMMLGFGRHDCRSWNALEVANYYSGLRQG